MREVGAGGGREGRSGAARRSAETIKCRRLQDVGLVGAAAAGMMMPEMIKAAAMMAAVMMAAAVLVELAPWAVAARSALVVREVVANGVVEVAVMEVAKQKVVVHKVVVQVVVVQVVAVDEVMAGAMVERMAVRMDDAVEAVMEAVGEGAVAVVLDAMDTPPAMLVMGAEVQVDRLELAIVALAWAVVPAEGWVPVAAVAVAATMAAAAGRQAVHSRAAKAVVVVAIVAVAAATTPHTAAGGRCRPGRAHTSKARRCADHNVGR